MPRRGWAAMSGAGAAKAPEPDPRRAGAEPLIDAEAEAIVLGSILRSGAAAFGLAADIGLASEHFAVSKHAFVFETAATLVTKGREPNLGEVVDTLGVQGMLWRVDGITGLLQLEERALKGKLVTGFCRKVRRQAQHRKAYELLEDMRVLIEGGAAGEEVCRVASQIQQVYLERSSRSGGRFGECLEQVGGYDALLAPPRNLVPFPFEGCVPGFLPGQLVTCGARPGKGKTIFGCHAAIRAARSGFRTLLVSLEMSVSEMLKRWLSMVARVRHDDLQKGTLPAEQRTQVMRAGYELDQIPLEVISEPNTLEGIGARIMQARAEGAPYGFVAVDYLSLVDVSAHRLETREQEVGFIARSLKRLAMANDLPILALAQLNRMSEQRKGREPELSDLRESGSIEQDSDVVMFVHRPERYNEPHYRDKAQLLVKKQRNGPLGRIEMLFAPDCVSFIPV